MPHVGHVRSAIVFDQLTRWLEARGFRVTSVRNVTDIDDKILEKSKASFNEAEPAPGGIRNEEWWALAYRYELEFNRAYDTLGVRRPTYEPRATGHIPEMQALIQELIDTGYAYPAPDGSGDVYFDVRSWPEYGCPHPPEHRRHAGRHRRRPARQARPARLRAVEGPQGHRPASSSWPSPGARGAPAGTPNAAP
jgi:cysteinyl-tRNA synthetase